MSGRAVASVALLDGGLNDAMQRVLLTDVLALVCLGVAALAHRLSPVH